MRYISCQRFKKVDFGHDGGHQYVFWDHVVNKFRWEKSDRDAETGDDFYISGTDACQVGINDRRKWQFFYGITYFSGRQWRRSVPLVRTGHQPARIRHRRRVEEGQLSLLV